MLVSHCKGIELAGVRVEKLVITPPPPPPLSLSVKHVFLYLSASLSRVGSSFPLPFLSPFLPFFLHLYLSLFI